MDKIIRLIALFIVFFFCFSAVDIVDKNDPIKLKPLERSLTISPSLESPESAEGCTIDEIDCYTCEESASDLCCQHAYEKCYYWLAVIED